MWPFILPRRYDTRNAYSGFTAIVEKKYMYFLCFNITRYCNLSHHDLTRRGQLRAQTYVVINHITLNYVKVT